MRGKTILRLYVVLVLVGISVARATSSCAVEFNFTYNSAVSTPPGDLNDNNGLITDLDGSVLTEMMDVAVDMGEDILLDE